MIGIFFLVSIGVIFFLAWRNSVLAPSSTPQRSQETSEQNQNDIPQLTVIAKNLDTPWAIAFLPDRSMLITERSGRVRMIDNNGNLLAFPVAVIDDVSEIGEGGLLGIAVHPNFSTNNYVYLYYTYSSTGNATFNRVVRMTYRNNSLTDKQIILDRIPGAVNHNGGRIKFGPDGFLYVSTGDAQNPSLAQEKSSLGGKILRITDEGKPAPKNPFNSPVFSYGHRNIQGLAWSFNGELWATEHGPSGGEYGTGNDEINRVEMGKNYGWPIIQGEQKRAGMVTPVRNSTPSITWAPSGAAFVKNSLFFGGLRGQALYEAVIKNNQVIDIKEHFKGQFGRIREVIVGPDSMLYITTSNRDGRGIPRLGDDRVIRINPQKL